MRTSLASCVLLLFVLTAYATTPTTSNASLKGAYLFQISGGHEHSFGATIICGGVPTFVGSSDSRPEVVAGTITFNGTGGGTGTFTEYGHFNQAASDASVSCTGSNAVYDPPASGTLTATYSVQSNATGAMTLAITGGIGGGAPGGFILRLAGACAGGISNTVFLIELKPDNSVENSGVARFQSTC